MIATVHRRTFSNLLLLIDEAFVIVAFIGDSMQTQFDCTDAATYWDVFRDAVVFIRYLTYLSLR